VNAAALRTDLSLSEVGEDNYEFIRALVYEHSRIHLGSNKKALVSSRLAKRLRALRLPDYDAYCNLLRSHKGREELGNLLDVISTNHTHFFREGRHFEFLRDVVLPQWKAKGGGALRIWSAACSSGEEPYSIAILLSENLSADVNWRVHATDISTRMLKTAQAGIYATERLSHVPAEWQRRYFQRGIASCEGTYRIKEEVRRRIDFQHVNLLQASYPFATRFDVIFCRNVMIYFDRETQETLINKVSDRLIAGGYLMVGHSESLSGIRHGLAALQPALYQKK
jgi:chemotaxis protein methyltransferase CheR